MTKVRREPRVPKRRTSVETRNAVLDAAEAVLRTEGVAAVTTTHVAQQADVSVGSVYEYFPSKEEILLALEERSWAVVSDTILSSAPAIVAGKNPREALAAIIIFCIDLIRERLELHGFTRDTPRTMESRRIIVAKMAMYLSALVRGVGGTMRVADPQFTFEVTVTIVINVTRIGTLYYAERMKTGEFQREIADMLVTHFLGPA